MSSGWWCTRMAPRNACGVECKQDMEFGSGTTVVAIFEHTCQRMSGRVSAGGNCGGCYMRCSVGWRGSVWWWWWIPSISLKPSWCARRDGRGTVGARHQGVGHRDLWEHIDWLRGEAGKKLRVRWVPSHLGVAGNEAADELVGQGRELHPYNLLLCPSGVVSRSGVHWGWS